MKKRGNQEFPFNNDLPGDDLFGSDLQRPPERSAQNGNAGNMRPKMPEWNSHTEPDAFGAAPVPRYTSRPDANVSDRDQVSPKPRQTVNSGRPERYAPTETPRYTESLYSPAYRPASELSNPRLPGKRTLDRQIRILAIISAVMAVVLAILVLFAFFGGRKEKVNSAASSSTSSQSTTASTDASLVTGVSTVAALSSVSPTPEQTTAAPDTDPTSLANMPPSDEHPVICLTFDDGPSTKLTPQLLDVLKQKGVHATFFLLGVEVADADPALLQRMVADGNEIGNHSYDHSSYKNLTEDQIREELQKTNDLILAATGITPTVMRPPSGESSDTVLKLSKEFGMATVNWSWESCPQDWLKENQTPEYIANHVIENAANGHIVLLHDIHQCTVDSISSMIDGLVAKGYRFATVSELLETLPGGKQDGVLYYYGK